MKAIILYCVVVLFFTACTGIKVIDPTKQNTNGTVAIDYSTGTPKVVETFSCTIVGANGKRVYGTGKSESLARTEAVAKCRDQTAISFCEASKVSCQKN